MALFVPGKKNKPGTAGLSTAEIRLRRRNASRGDDGTPTAPPAAPSTLEELLAEREQLYTSLHTSQNVQTRALALTGRLEQRFATERKSLEEEINTLKDREKALVEASQRYKNDLDKEIEKRQLLNDEKAQLEEFLEAEREDHVSKKQALQSALDEECCRNAELGQSIEAMKHELQSLQITIANLQSVESQLQADVERKRNELLTLQSENVNLQRGLVTEQQANTKTQEECDRWKNTADNLKSINRQLKEKIESQIEEILTFRTENAKVKEDLIIEQQSNAETKEECDRWKSAADNLQSIIRRLKEEIENQSNEISTLGTENAKVLDDLVLEQQANTNTKRECEQWKRRFNDMETSSLRTIVDLKRKLEEEEDARDAAVSRENELRNQAAKLLKEIDQKENRIQELEVANTSEVLMENTVTQETQEFPDSQSRADVKLDDDSLVQNELDSDSSITGRERHLVQATTTKSPIESRKRKQSISASSSSGLNIESFLINPKKRVCSPTPPNSSVFNFKNFLVDRDSSRSNSSNLSRDRSNRLSVSSIASLKPTAKKTLLSLTPGRRTSSIVDRFRIRDPKSRMTPTIPINTDAPPNLSPKTSSSPRQQSQSASSVKTLNVLAIARI